MRVDDGTEQRERERGLVLPFVIVAIAFFVLGLTVANTGMPSLLLSKIRSYDEGEQIPASELAVRINEVARYLDDTSIYGFDGAEATEGAINALLSSSEDAYAEYLDTDYYASFLKYSSGSYTGVGITIADVGRYAMVTGVYEDGPAAKAGVEPGYVAVSVDGEEREWTALDLSKAIEREEGETVDITWLKPTEDSLAELAEAYYEDAGGVTDDGAVAAGQGDAADEVVLEGERIDTEMEYTSIVIPNVASEMLDDVGYVRLYSFNGEAGDAVDEAVRELQDEGARALVLDLRNNGGGYVDQAVHIVSSFVENGDVLQMRAKKRTITDSVTGDVVTDLPLVVLVNDKSASASEIVAAALKDHGRATIVGTTTYGKGTVQNYVKLSFGGAVKFTIAEYLSPNGNPINGVGVKPDVEIDAGDGFVLGQSEDDAQLERALDVARELAAEEGGDGDGGEE